jgi:hypothetical protein
MLRGESVYYKIQYYVNIRLKYVISLKVIKLKV